ncbi:serine hydrolase [Secundilactobacillus hailunensis]|uniref:serine hydrolase n=1 Tax=Secundilactobacillus hailunensis TaxID=2559923 RepID=UPI0036D22ED2
MLGGCQRASASYNRVLKTSNRHYDAQIINQLGSGYAIYNDGPYNTSRSTKTRDANGSNYRDDYVRVMQTKTTKTGSYVKLRYFNKYLGWMHIHGIKPTSFKNVAQGTMQNAGFLGSVALIPAGGTTPTVINTGYASITNKLSNSSDGTVVYPLASLQKAITGVIIEQLISQRKIAANTQLSKYYPQVANSKQITIKQLLSMTSGISNSEQFPRQSLNEQQAVDLAIKVMKVNLHPGYHYSDDNFVLLAGIIAKVTGKSYMSNVETRIFSKAGMHESILVEDKPIHLTNKLAESYTLKGKANYMDPNVLSFPRASAIVGAGNILTTPTDYLKFVLSLQNGVILTKQQYQQFLSYGSHYSGGLFVSRPGEVYNNGSFSGQGYHTGYDSSKNNYHVAVVFSNQSPLRNNLSQGDFVYLMYQIAADY